MDWGYTPIWMCGLRYITHLSGTLGPLTQTHCRCRAGSQFVNGHQFAEAAGKRFVSIAFRRLSPCSSDVEDRARCIANNCIGVAANAHYATVESSSRQHQVGMVSSCATSDGA